MTLRAQLEQVASATGRVPPELETGEPPEALAHIWRWFLELNKARQQAFEGIAPLTWEALSAWSALTGERLRPREVRLLVDLDLVFREAMSGKAAGNG